VNPNEGNDGGGKKMRARNASTDDEEGEVAERKARARNATPYI
jgi:hypothetical protein